MSALAPIDLLFAPADEQAILRALAREPDMTLTMLAQQTRRAPERLEAQLNELLQGGRVVERLRQGQRTFSMRFARSQAAVRNMPASMLEMFAPISAETVLSQHSITRELPPSVQESLLALSTRRQLIADEIVIWQGQLVQSVALVQSGLLRKTRLHGQSQADKVPAGQAANDYLRRGAWVGLSEAFSQYPSPNTYTALGEGELIVWSLADLANFAEQQPAFAQSLNRWLSRSWQECQRSSQQTEAHIWAVTGEAPGLGTTTVAANLAQHARSMADSNQQKVLLWNATADGDSLMRALGTTLRTVSAYRVDGERMQPYRGVDVVVDVKRGDYPLQVQVDMLLGHYRNDYDLIICDLGIGNTELAQKLNVLADTVITLLSGEPKSAERKPQQPHQKQFLLCNQTTDEHGQANMSLPCAGETVTAAFLAQRTLTEFQPESDFALSIRELVRRLSLNHTLGIFIPSTFDVDVHTDNKEQVDSALTFFGQTFGGATRSEAEGVWMSDSSDLVTEQVTVVRTFVTKSALDRHLDDVIQFAVDLKQTMRQEAVAVDVDSQLVLV